MNMLGKRCFHASEIALRKPDLKNRRVTIIGGGQTGAEVFLNCLNGIWGQCQAVSWFSRRDNLEPLDETPFTNDLFAPAYQKLFRDLPIEAKKSQLAKQKLASDGISPDTLREIYQTLYQHEVNNTTPNYCIKPSHELRSLDMRDTGIDVNCINKINNQWHHSRADIVILATGYEYQLPYYLKPLTETLNCDPQFGLTMDENYRVAWQGPKQNRIYGLNAGLMSHGIADPQLSLNAVRSATIVNDLCGQTIYSLNDYSYLNWQDGIANEAKPSAA